MLGHAASPSRQGRGLRRGVWRWFALTLAAAAVSAPVTYAYLGQASVPLQGTAVVMAEEPPAPPPAALAVESPLAVPEMPALAVPTPSSPYFIRAIRLHRAGQLNEAVSAYSDVVARDPRGPEAAAALIAYGQAQVGLRHYGEAQTAFQRVLSEHPAGVHRGEALFWQGKLAEAQGDSATAAARYRDAAAELTGIEAYVRTQAADALAKAGNPAAAVVELERASLAPATASLHERIVTSLAEYTEQAGDLPGALQRYRDLFAATQNPWVRSGYQLRVAELLRRAGDVDGAQQLLEDLLVRYPSTSYAGTALDALQSLKRTVSPLIEGVVSYYQRNNDRATAALEQALLDPNADHGRALYFLGLLALRADATSDALMRFDQFLAEHSNHALADDVRMERALLFEWTGRLHDAIAALRELRQASPQGQHSGEAGFREGLALYKLGDPLGAAAAWVQAQDGAAVAVRTRNLFWAGKALTQAGDAAGATALWQEAAGLRPGSYYSERAQTMVNSGGVAIPNNPGPFSAGSDASVDTQELETWLASWAASGQPLPSMDDTRRGLMSDARFQRGERLLTLGLRSEAIEEFRELRTERRRDPVAQVALIDLFRERDLYHLAASAGYSLLDLSGQNLAQAPVAVQRAISPAPFADLLNKEAVSRGVDPLVFLALIHQESAFDAGATSSASALGLTQVMPSTGRELARQLGVRDFEPDDLLRPTVSLQFGAQYLAEQMRRFNGNALVALAAYNAGPGSAQRWLRSAGGDLDLFVEEIDYTQTSTYVKKIAEAAARYRALYGRN